MRRASGAWWMIVALMLTRLPALAVTPVHLLPGLGTHHFPVTTRSARAQAFVDQGLALVYGFNHDEAIRAFDEAARLDPRCAMASWGTALALGPNYNLPIDSERAIAARRAIDRAVALAPATTPREQAYITALARRYGRTPAHDDRTALDRAYTDAMRKVVRRFPDDLDAAVLFAESLMVLRPWDLWTLDGQPQPGTEEIVATLEGVLARDPGHPGANHYYVHAMEASPHPERALRAADTVAATMPAAGHIVHMPSHIYMRVGRYADAADTNTRAIAVDAAYLRAEQPQGPYPMMYVPHNIQFLWSAASMEGRSVDALDAARQVDAMIDPDGLRAMPAMEYFAPTLAVALVRFGKWHDVLAVPRPGDEFPFALGMWHHARGLALASTGEVDQAETALAALRRLVDVVPADRIIGDNQPARRHLELAVAVLAGEIAARRGATDDAVTMLTNAVRLEDGLPYTEPPAWYQPVRHRLGAVLLRAGRAPDAEAVYRADLQRAPDNGWALCGLREALRRQRKGAEVAEVETRFVRAWARADMQPTLWRD